MSEPRAPHDVDDTEQHPIMNQADSSVERTALENENAEMTNSSSSEESMTTTEIVVNSSREHVYDPTKISLKFIFANRDGVNVILDCKPSSTVAEVKGALLSMWPKGEIMTFTCFLNCSSPTC